MSDKFYRYLNFGSYEEKQQGSMKFSKAMIDGLVAHPCCAINVLPDPEAPPPVDINHRISIAELLGRFNGILVLRYIFAPCLLFDETPPFVEIEIYLKLISACDHYRICSTGEVEGGKARNLQKRPPLPAQTSSCALGAPSWKI